MTLVILGIDALDAKLVEYFETDELQLATHGEMQTFAYKNPIPYTGEVWPAIATGKHPTETGFTHGRNSKWDSQIIDFASNLFGPYLNYYWRQTLGSIIQRATGADWQLNEIDEPSFFDGASRYVHNWPCTVNGNAIQRVWREIDTAVSDQHSIRKYKRQSACLAAEKFGWLKEALEFDASLVATHIHFLDSGGHAFGDDELNYRWCYEKVCSHVEEIKNRMAADDDMLILSDHGMNTSWIPQDGEVGHHSFRAYSASTYPSRPTDVLDVYDWVEWFLREHEQEDITEQPSVEFPEEHLRDMGYIA